MGFLVFIAVVAFVVVLVLRAVGNASSGPARNPRRRRDDGAYPYPVDASSDDRDRDGSSGWFSDLFSGGDSGDSGGGSDGSGGDGGGD